MEPIRVLGKEEASMAFKSSKVAWVVVAVSLIAVSSFAFLPSSGDPTTFKVSAAGDAYVSTANPTAAYGKDVDVWVSKGGSVENWGYLSFDIASKLPAGVVVVKARLKLLVDQSYGVFPAQTVAGRLLADFNEATLTYNTAPAASFDISTNTLFAKRPMLGFTVFIDVTGQLMTWRNSGQRTLFGLVLTMDHATANAGIAFASRENTLLEGPVLQVFTLPPGQYGYSISPGEILAVRTSN